MKIHALKIAKQHFNDILDGSKKAELRLNDRDYKVGDLIFFEQILLLNGIIIIPTHPRNRWLKFFYVTHIIDDSKYLQPGYVMMSLEPIFIDPFIINNESLFRLPGRIYDNIEVNKEVIKKFLKNVIWEDL